MSLRDLAITMALFTTAVVAIVVIGAVAFKKWSKRERSRRGSEIAMGYLDPDCAEIPKRPRAGED